MIKFFGTIEGVSFIPSPKMVNLWNEFCAKNKGKLVSMAASVVYKKRTLKQNSALYGPWIDHCIKNHRKLGVVKLRDAGSNALKSDEAKWWIQVNFFPRRKYIILGEPHQRIPGSSELSSAEMAKALDDYNEFWMDQGMSEFVPQKIFEEYEEYD